MSKFNVSRFIRGIVSVGVGSLSTLIFGMLVIMVVARYVSEEELGSFILFQIISAFLVQISSLGLNISITRFVTGDEGDDYKRQLVNTAICFRILTAAVVGLLAFPARPLLAALFNAPLIDDLFWFVPLMFIFESMWLLLKSILQGFFLFKKNALIEFSGSLFNFVLAIVAVVLLHQGIVGLLWARVGALITMAAIAYLALPIKHKLEFHLAIIKPVLSFGLPLQFNDILHFTFTRIDVMMLGALLGPTSIAYYEIARKLPMSILRLYEAFRTVLFPHVCDLFRNGEKQQFSAVVNHSTRLISFITAAGALITLLFGEEIILVLFSEKYLASTSTFIIIMIGLNIRMIGNVLGTSLVAAGESQKPVFINTFHMLTTLVSNIILIPIFGPPGAALASLLGTAMASPLNVLFLSRCGITIDVRGNLKPLMIFAIFLFLVPLLEPMLLIYSVLSVAGFLVASVLLSVVVPEDLTILWREARVTGLFDRLRRLKAEKPG